MFGLVLGGILAIYTIVYAIRKIVYIRAFYKAKLNNKLLYCDAYIIEKIDEKKNFIRGEEISSFFPKFEYVINNKKNFYVSSVRYKNARIGQELKLAISNEVNETWGVDEIPFIKKNLIMKVILIFALLGLLFVTELYL